MSYLFDTNAVIHLMKLREPLVGRARHVGPARIAVSAITLAELWYGAARSQRPGRSRDEQDAALAPFRVLDFDATCAHQYAATRAVLEKAETPIGDRDLMIAAIALANRLTLVTSSSREFEPVRGLAVEDWLTA